MWNFGSGDTVGTGLYALSLGAFFQCRFVLVPLLFQLCEQRLKTSILAKVVEIVIAFEEDVARKAIVSD